MAGRPLRAARAEHETQRLAKRNPVIFPGRRTMPIDQWKALTPAEKMQQLYGESLNFCYRVMADSDDWPHMSAHELAMLNSVRHDIMMIGAKVGLEMWKRSEDADRVAELNERMQRARSGQSD